MSNEHKPDYAVIPPTGAFSDQNKEARTGSQWPSKFTLPQGPSGAFSQGGWTEGNEGFLQQSFLGASIRSFNINGGFGDTSSNLSVELVVDEYNKADQTPLGVGDDVYHSGNGDAFIAPPVGTPVFFKFGKNWATVEQAYRRTIDQTYGISSLDKIEFEEFLETSGAFSTTPYEDSGKMPDEREKYYLRSQDKTRLFEDPRNPTDDTRTWVNKSELFEHDNKDRGQDHFVFGGILQSVTETRTGGGNPLQAVQVVDPREILSNCAVILNDYAGTTFNNKNLFNVYGFLEYDPSDDLQERLDEKARYKWIVEKQVDQTGLVRYVGHDKTKGTEAVTILNNQGEQESTQVNPSNTNWDLYSFQNPVTQGPAGKIFSPDEFPKFFPITGEGFARRSEQGIPWYRVSQGLAALLEQHGSLPEEYVNAGFGGTIDFRGFNYVVDFGGIPLEKIPNSYMLNYSQLDLLSLTMELCDIISHDLFVSLLPVIDPLTNIKQEIDEKAAIMNSAFAKNAYWTEKAAGLKADDPKRKEYLSNIIHGIIRIDTVDKSKQPSYGSIQSYINNLESQGIYVENRDLGFELSNETTDKFIAGAQEVEMHYFSTHKDRDSLEHRKQIAGVPNSQALVNEKQWTLEASLKQQVLPFYGFLGKKALSIPRGFGAYQQIMLDATALDAHGVGNYYVTTEMELRHALKSYQSWSEFLARYNESYIEEVGELKGFYNALSKTTSKDIEGLGVELSEPLGTCHYQAFEDDPNSVMTSPDSTKASCDNLNGTWIETAPSQLLNREFGVTVPRCVFNSDKNFMGADGYPASPCSPPYGYPLYYKRAEKIGIEKAGAAKVSDFVNKTRTNLEKIREYGTSDPQNNFISTQITTLEDHEKMLLDLQANAGEGVSFDLNETLLCIEKVNQGLIAQQNYYTQNSQDMAQVENALRSVAALSAQVSNFARRSKRNSEKIYEFVKNIAEENLGKKFLVKIPKDCNINYSETLELKKYYSKDPIGNVSEVTNSISDIYRGPLGFKPLPVNSGVYDLVKSQEYLMDMEKIRSSQASIKTWDYQRFLYQDPFDETYKYGALKSNFNPISEKWAFNYKPEPQGGFFNFALYPRNLSLSQLESRGIKDKAFCPATQYHLTPKDLTNFVEDNGRISCYVRYNDSEHLDFRGVSSDSITQEVIKGNSYIPDILSDLDNVNTNHQESMNSYSMRQSGPDKRPSTVAYVKCSVDEQLYMPPKSEETPAMVFGRDVKWIPNQEPSYPVVTEDENGCPVYDCVKPYAAPVFAPSHRFKETASKVGYERVLAPQEYKFDDKTYSTTTTFGDPNRVIQGGGLDSTVVTHVEYVRKYEKETDSFIIDTEIENLDDNHVYALITIPGIVSTTVNKRYADAMEYAKNGAIIKNTMTQDVVRGVEGFEKPAEIVNRKVSISCDDFSFEDLESAQKAQRAAIQGALDAFGSQQVMQSAPSPIYPDIVALPLMSTERCYGPWRSAASLGDDRERYTDIGGKIEFVKDENLAPWNYAGYQLMDEAGKLQAEFSNSLLLFSERGGFVFPSHPSGMSIGRELQKGGPLITSLSVGVSEAGIKTTVKMDLYTSRFGKLQKQKEEAIAQITRERQKIIDNNNEMIRKGMIRSATNPNTFGVTNNFAAGRPLETTDGSFDGFKKAGKIMIAQQKNREGTGSNGNSVITKTNDLSVSNMSPEEYTEGIADIGTAQAGKVFNSSADEELGVPAATNIPSTILPAARFINTAEKGNKFNDMLSTPRENEELA